MSSEAKIKVSEKYRALRLSVLTACNFLHLCKSGELIVDLIALEYPCSCGNRLPEL